MKCFYIDADRCIREASKGHVVHLKDNLYLISTETASQQKLGRVKLEVRHKPPN